MNARRDVNEWHNAHIGAKNRLREAELAAEFTFFPQMDPKVCDCEKVAAVVRRVDQPDGRNVQEKSVHT